MQGEFSVAVHSLTEAVTETRMHVEAAIDFPEEEIDFLADTALRARIDGAIELCAQIAAKARQGALLREGMTVVIAGRPNAGKSSLLNRLAGYDAAIVTAIPGTTRDVLRERIAIDGMPLHIADTAGLRDEADVVEAEGIRRARQEMSRADRILYVIDGQRRLGRERGRARARDAAGRHSGDAGREQDRPAGLDARATSSRSRRACICLRRPAKASICCASI